MSNRLVIGDVTGSGDYRLRISKPGFDVLNLALAPENIIFDSSWGNAISEIHQSGSLSFTHTWTYTPGTMSLVKKATWSDLGFIPICINTAQQYETAAGPTYSGTVDLYIDNTGLYIPNFGSNWPRNTSTSYYSGNYTYNINYIAFKTEW